MLNIESTEKSVIFSDGTKSVYPKNLVHFEISSSTVYFFIGAEKINNIVCNEVQLTSENANDLLSAALFREASGSGSGSGGNEKFKGYYTSQTLLQEVYPSPKEGDYAYAGTPYPGTVYKCEQEAIWKNSGEIPPAPEQEDWDQTDW